jgi:hypothetical protein
MEKETKFVRYHKKAYLSPEPLGKKRFGPGIFLSI